MVNYRELLELSGNFTNEFCKDINKNKDYNEAAKGWGIDFEGSLLWRFEASGEIEDDIALYLDLKDGKCLGIKLLAPSEEPPRTPILTLRAPLKNWLEIRTKKLNPTQFIMSGKLKIEGNIALAMRYSRATTLLGKISGKQTFLRKLFTEYNLGQED